MEMVMKCVLVLVACVCLTETRNLQNATRILLLEEAQQKDAVCLDGSAPGYYMRPGQAEGRDKWILHLKGGGWCNDRAGCLQRSLTMSGSTKDYPDSSSLEGFLSDDPQVNPDFHNWNVIAVIYCDGASFSGNREEPDVVEGRTVYYRGYRILLAVIEDLLKERGMAEASDVILTGCSSGALAVFLHADLVASMMPPGTKFRGFPDAGYFIDIPNVYGQPAFREGFETSMENQNIYTTLMPTCKAEHAQEMWKCMFPPYVFDYIRTPLFVLNSMYDTSQLLNYQLSCLPDHDLCSSEDMKLFHHFKAVLDKQMQPVLNSPLSNGYFFDACLTHCQTTTDESWGLIVAAGHLMRESFADWYYERPSSLGATRVKDCDFPCNPTCPA